MKGITAYGVYLPRLRLNRQAMVEANAWFDSSLKGLGKGERSICNWDEDTITMAVEAGIDCLSALQDKSLSGLNLASTTAPFVDRQNSVLVAEAMNLNSQIRTMDIGSSQRAATSALIAGLESARPGNEMIIASEHRRTKAGSRAEMLWGDGAAALTVGDDEVIAQCLAVATNSVDFVDHYRGEGSDFDYDWEERWIRDEGWLKLVPDAVAAALQKAGVAASDVDHMIVPAHMRRVPESVAKRCGVNAEAVTDPLMHNVGQCGVAHPLLMLCSALANAEAGQIILVTGFGQGADALVFEVTAAIANTQPGLGVAGWLDKGVQESNYAKLLTYTGVVEREYGKRAELDRSPVLTAQYRNRRGVTGFVGGRCTRCGTVQFPKSNYCVNPNCGAKDTQEDHPMSGVQGVVKTWTADRLVFSMDPPAYFGLVEFEGGGRTMVDFTEVDPDTFDVGTATTMRFRVKFVDERRGMRQYFWKAAPA